MLCHELEDWQTEVQSCLHRIRTSMIQLYQWTYDCHAYHNQSYDSKKSTKPRKNCSTLSHPTFLPLLGIYNMLSINKFAAPAVIVGNCPMSSDWESVARIVLFELERVSYIFCLFILCLRQYYFFRCWPFSPYIVWRWCVYSRCLV